MAMFTLEEFFGFTPFLGALELEPIFLLFS